MAKRKGPEPISTEQVMEALRQRYQPPAWAFLPQVRNGTGWQRSTRTADALAMSLWPSRGLELHGFEVKVSRSDWKRELDNPAKAEEIAGFCDRWWLVVGDAEIVQPGELPATWGLLAPNGDSLACTVEAQRLDAKQLDRSFVAAILRRVTEDWKLVADVQREIRDQVEREKPLLMAQAQDEAARLQRSNEELHRAISEFESASGVRISAWDGKQIGDAVRAVLQGEAERHRMRLENLRTSAEQIVRAIDESLKRAPMPTESFT